MPQGSSFGPTLFDININDLASNANYFKKVLFADNSCLYLAHNNISTTIEIINNELDVID